jgi:guanylate kinase
MAQTRCGRLVVVSGPSGAGKTTLLGRVLECCELPLVRSVSATTRPPRPGETDGVDYHFLTPDLFREYLRRGEFLECYEVFNRGYWYGTLRSEVTAGLAAGRWVVLNVDVNGALAVMEQFADAITIFVRPSSMDELERRLRDRGTETEEAIRRRLAQARHELTLAERYRWQVINDDIDQAVNEICTILTNQWETDRDDRRTPRGANC